MIAPKMLARFGALLLATVSPTLAAPPTTVTVGGITLRSLAVELPNEGRGLPEGGQAELVSQNCLSCHTAGMILNQPPLSKATWEEEVNKMRNAYKAPVAPGDVAPIVGYLVRIKGVN